MGESQELPGLPLDVCRRQSCLQGLFTSFFSIWSLGCSHIAALEYLCFCTRQGWGPRLGLWFSSLAGPVERCRDQTDSDLVPPAFHKGSLKYQSHLSHVLSTSGKTIPFAFVSAWTNSWETSFWCLTHCYDAGEIWREIPKWYYLKGQDWDEAIISIDCDDKAPQMLKNRLRYSSSLMKQMKSFHSYWRHIAIN